MFRLVPILALLGAGCNDGVAPPFLSGDLAVSLDEGVDFSQMPDSGGPSLPDLSGDGAPARSCTSACDCVPGESCRAGICEMGSSLIFCCDAASCTGSSLCQFPDKTFSQCGSPADGGLVRPDGGASSAACSNITCTPGSGGNLLCKLACGAAAMCVGGGTPHCVP